MTTDLDTALEMVAAAERRRILRMVDRHEILTQSDLFPPDDQRRQIAIVHQHLPELASADIITWDRETGTISRGPRYDAVKACLDVLDAHADELPVEIPGL